VSEATDQFQRPLKGVDAMEAMIANVEQAAAELALLALDIKHQTLEDRILGPTGTHGSFSFLGRSLPLFYTPPDVPV
jgi:hypothetical protein